MNQTEKIGFKPRKCVATGRHIASTDTGSVKIKVAKLNPEGLCEGEEDVFDFGSFARSKSLSDKVLTDFVKNETVAENPKKREYFDDEPKRKRNKKKYTK